jgi:hypothetical protein
MHTCSVGESVGTVVGSNDGLVVGVTEGNAVGVSVDRQLVRLVGSVMKPSMHSHE